MPAAHTARAKPIDRPADFAACITGPLGGAAELPAKCDGFDGDRDGDVDLFDWHLARAD